MRHSGLFAALILTVAVPAPSGTRYRYVYDEKADLYFGHVSYCDPDDGSLGPQVLRGEVSETAQVNLPLTPGDRILTPPSRRCEVQFDTGTLLRVDTGASLLLETVLASSLSSGKKLTNLVLETGRVRVLYRDYDSSEVFQVLTANAAVRLDRAAVVEITTIGGGTSLRVEKGRAALLYGPGPRNAKSRKLKAGDSATVTHSDALEWGVAPPAAPAFAGWNRDLDGRFTELHRGRSKLPKKVYKYPPAVVHFAERWSSAYGEWIWTDFYGYAWRPYLSRDEGWRPFLMGQWTSIDGQRYWVPQEPWGWVPYHLGLWHWDARDGWVWIPGSTFAPAWVVWTQCANDVVWRPIGLWDWGFWQDPSRPPGYSLFSGGPEYLFVGPTARCGTPSFGGPPATDSQQLVTASSSAPVPRPTPDPEPEPDDVERPKPPREIRKLVERFGKQVALGDPDAIASVQRVSAAVGILVRPAAATLQEDDGTPRSGAPARAMGDAEPETPRPVETAAGAEPAPEVSAPNAPPAAPEPARPVEARFRDWNPDVRAARDVGGRIRYDSERNAVACDGCRRPLSRPAWLARAAGGSGSGASASGDSSSGGASATAASSGSGGGAAASGARAGAGPAEKREHD